MNHASTTESFFETYQGIVQKLIYGGKGLIRLPTGLFVHVLDVLPQEQVKIAIKKQHKNYAEGILDEVILPSCFRISPRCRHFGMCGGCQLQHISYPEQCAIKQGWLKEALHGLVESTFDVRWSSSNDIWCCRRKIVLHAKKTPKGVLLGYISRDKVLFQCHECPIFFEDHEIFLLDEIRDVLGLLDHWKEMDIVLFRRPSNGISLQFRIAHEPSQWIREVKKRLEAYSCLEEACIPFRDGRSILIFSKELSRQDLSFCFHDIRFGYSEEAFVQTHSEQPFYLWEDVRSSLLNHSNKGPLLDLYSGIGVTAILAAQLGHEVTAVELSEKACQACQRTANLHSLKSIRVICSPVEKWLTVPVKKFQSIIVNPPREGLSEGVLSLLAQSRAQEMHYISCQPATLRRDLVRLCRAGWRLISAKGYDMFPQTTHFETYVRLSSADL